MSKINIEEITEKLDIMDISIVDKNDYGNVPAYLKQLAETMYAYDTYDIYVDLTEVKELNSGLGTLITYKDYKNNNGVYVFTVRADGSIGLLVVEPSTIAKGPIIKQATGTISNAIANLDIPSLSIFDQTEVVGYVIADTIIKPLMDALNIEAKDRAQFTNIYLPRFLSNVAQQYIGSSTLKEEVIEMEPQFVKQLLESQEEGDE